MKAYLKFAGRLLGFNAAAAAISIIIMMPVSSVAASTGSAALQWGINALFVAFSCGLIWKISSDEGSRNTMRQRAAEKRAQETGTDAPAPEFLPAKGFISGALAQIPLLIVMLAYFICDLAGASAAEMLDTILRFYYIMYNQVYLALPGAVPWIFLAFAAINVLVAGMGYRDGKRQHMRMVAMIARNEQNRLKKGGKGPAK